MTPTLKAAEVAAAETGADGRSAAWLIHQHGWRWDADGHWTRQPNPLPDPSAQLRPGDLLLVDEAGMLGQDTARAILTIADETGARVAFVGDRHQLPAVGRGGVLDHAVAWAHPTAVVRLDTVHRFTDPDYAALSLRMRNGDDPGSVFDALHRRGSDHDPRHPTVERTAALADAGAAGDLVIADTREQVADLNAAIRDHRQRNESAHRQIITARGERIGLRRPGRDPTQRSRTSGGEPPDVDRHGDRGGRQPPPARPWTRSRGPGRLREPVRRNSPTPPPSTAPKETPSTLPTSPSAIARAPRRRTSR
ncbi:MAG: AAA family ATPase [Nocardioidaceae bacterium]